MKKIVKTISLILIFLMLFSISSFALTPEEYYGDINHDGKITSSDARGILRIAAMIDKISDEEFIYADVNRDGQITSSDARTTLRVSAMLENPVKIKTENEEDIEEDIVTQLSTFIEYPEFVEKHKLDETFEGEVNAYRNLAGNFVILDEKANRASFDIKVEKNTEGEYAGMYSFFITDEKLNKTFTVISDNEHLIMLEITDVAAVAIKFLDYTNSEEYNEDNENYEVLGYWIYFSGDIDIELREPISVVNENIEKAANFKECQGTTEAIEDYPNAKFFLNELQNAIIIDERTNKTSFDINCTIELDKQENKEKVFKIVINYIVDDVEEKCECEIGECDLAIINIADDGYYCVTTSFMNASDYVIP